MQIPDEQELTLAAVLSALRARLRLLLIVPLAAGLIALGVTSVISPTFTASATFLPPQQAPSNAASALASLGSLASLAGGAAGVGSVGERYVALLRSVAVTDSIINRFGLIEVYEKDFRIDARRTLGGNVRIVLGKKDGLINIEVDDHDPKRAAAMANQHVIELQRVTASLAVTEAQQRRMFFEGQLQRSRDRLAVAQTALQNTGFNAGALKTEPKAAAEAYARLKAEATATEVRLETLRGNFADGTPEVRQQQRTLAALRDQLAQAEQISTSSNTADYVSKYREFKYQETLFELYARQFELARADESREGALIQVIDPATPPEKKSGPKRALIAVTTTVAVGGLLVLGILLLTSVQSRPRGGRRSDESPEPLF